MNDELDHSARVSAWMDGAAGRDAEQLIAALDRAFAALWSRAERPLGEVTLRAILDRVLYTAVERFPDLAPLAIGTAGLDCSAMLERGRSMRREQIEDGVRFLLVEYLTVLGNLTAEILTPALHAELAKLGPA